VVVSTAVFSLASPQDRVAAAVLDRCAARRRPVTDAPIVVQQREREEHRGAFS